MRIFVALSQEIEHTDVIGVYRTSATAWTQPGVNEVEVFNLDDVDEGEPGPLGYAPPETGA